jgi:hypothetical protein
MRLIMNDPGVRQRVSQATKVGRLSPLSDDMGLPRSLWLNVSPGARKRFLEEIFSPLCVDRPRFADVSDKPANLLVPDQAANLPVEARRWATNSNWAEPEQLGCVKLPLSRSRQK